MKTEDLVLLNQKIIALFQQVVDDPMVMQFHPEASGKPGYRSLRVDICWRSEGLETEWMLYCGGKASDHMGCVYGNSVPDIFNKIKGFDPEVKKQRQIAALKAQLEKLEAPAPVAVEAETESAVRG